MLSVPPECFDDRRIHCEGDAFGARIAHTQFLECRVASATVRVDGFILEGTNWNGNRITLDEFTLDIANDGRLVVTVGEKSESIRNCEEKR